MSSPRHKLRGSSGRPRRSGVPYGPAWPWGAPGTGRPTPLSARSLGPPASAAGAQRYLIYISPVPPGSGEPESNQSSSCDTCALAIILRPSGSVSLCAPLITEDETGPTYKRFGPVFAFEFSIFCRYLQSLLSFRHSQQAYNDLRRTKTTLCKNQFFS